jgi:hypothetical protein
MTSQQQPRKTLYKPFLEPLPFYFTTPSPSQYIPLPQQQKSLVNQVSPQDYRPEDSLSYLNPIRTFEYKQYQLLTEDDRLLKESAMSPGPAPFQPFQLPRGGRFLLGVEVDRLRVAKPGPGSYSPEPNVRTKVPCAAGWRASIAPTPTAQAAIDGSESAGPGSFLGVTKRERIGLVSWGSGVGGRFDTQEVDQTGPLIGPGSYEVNDTRCFGKSGSSAIIRAEHDTAVLIRKMKNSGVGSGGSSGSKHNNLHKQKNHESPASPSDTMLGSMSKTKGILEMALRKTAKEILYESKKELERDEQERLSLSCLGNSTRVTNVQFRRMTQKRMLARQKIAALIKKSNRLKMAIQELEFKNWSKPK